MASDCHHLVITEVDSLQECVTLKQSTEVIFCLLVSRCQGGGQLWEVRLWGWLVGPLYPEC